MRRFRRRTRLFIARKFQIRYITLIMVLMFATVLITGYMVYVTTWTMFGEKLAEVYPQGLLFDIAKKVNMVLLLRFVFLSPIVVLIGLVLSNRIAGPLYRINRFIQKISRGNYNNHLELRRGDELQDLSRMLNHLSSRLKSENIQRREKVGAIKEKTEILKSEISSGYLDKDKTLRRIEEIRKEIETLS